MNYPNNFAEYEHLKCQHTRFSYIIILDSNRTKKQREKFIKKYEKDNPDALYILCRKLIDEAKIERMTIINGSSSFYTDPNVPAGTIYITNAATTNIVTTNTLAGQIITYTGQSPQYVVPSGEDICNNIKKIF